MRFKRIISVVLCVALLAATFLPSGALDKATAAGTQINVRVTDDRIKTASDGRKYFPYNGKNYYLTTTSDGITPAKITGDYYEYDYDLDDIVTESSTTRARANYESYGYFNIPAVKFGWGSYITLGSYDLSTIHAIKFYVASDGNMPDDSATAVNGVATSNTGGIGAYITIKSQAVTANFGLRDKNDTATLGEAHISAGSTGSVNLSGAGSTSTWGKNERLVTVDLSDVTYSGNITVAPYLPTQNHPTLGLCGNEIIIPRIVIVTNENQYYYFNTASSETREVSTITTTRTTIQEGYHLSILTSDDAYIRVYRTGAVPTEDAAVFVEGETVGGTVRSFNIDDVPLGTYDVHVFTDYSSYISLGSKTVTIVSSSNYTFCIDYINEVRQSGAGNTNEYYNDKENSLKSDGTIHLRGWCAAEFGISKWVYSTNGGASWNDMASQQIFSRTELADAGVAYSNGHSTAGFDIVTGDLREVYGNYNLRIAAVTTYGTICEVYNLYVSNVGGDDFCAVSPACGASVRICNVTVKNYCDVFSKYNAVYSTDIYNGQSLTYNTGNIYAPVATKFAWNYSETPLYYILTIATDDDFSDAKYIKTENTSVEVEDLFAAKTYYWKVKAVFEYEAVESEVYAFTTRDYIRAVWVDGVCNTRDFGGKDTVYGVKTKQGIVYRGEALSGASDEGEDKLLNQLGIKTDLDLKSGDSSPIDVDYFYSFAGAIYDSSAVTSLAGQLRVFADEANYPIYFHCAIGRDRTGTLALLLNGLLGVSYTDAYMDYEFSLLSEIGNNEGNTPDNWYNSFITNNTGTFLTNLGVNSTGSNFNDCCYNYVKNTLGLSDAEISAIRENMLEGSDTGETNARLYSVDSGAEFISTDEVEFEVNPYGKNTIIDRIGKDVDDNDAFVIAKDRAISELITSAIALTKSASAVLTDANGNEVTEGLIKTGYKVVCTAEDSTVTTYGVIVKGDINSDGSVTLDDTMYLIKNILSEDYHPVFAKQDLNADGDYTLDDAMLLIKYVLSDTGYTLY